MFPRTLDILVDILSKLPEETRNKILEDVKIDMEPILRRTIQLATTAADKREEDARRIFNDHMV